LIIGDEAPVHDSVGWQR